uniref:Zgc:162324 n=1 Tax=Echeneis naucrates TaxID=173247 RepID=A0A665UF16_ECHNA
STRAITGPKGRSVTRLLLFTFTQLTAETYPKDNNKLKPVDSSHYNLPLLGSLKMHGDDDEELRMLASLKREQEEDECKGSGLSASQIHQCDVSISMSSDDTSTWTHISMVLSVMACVVMTVYMYGLFPREWMDVLSPPIMPPSQQRSDFLKFFSGEEEPVNEEGNDEEYLNLFYDPCLKCYFDPQTGKYYELA